MLYSQFCDSKYEHKLSTTSIELMSRKLMVSRRQLLRRRKQKTLLSNLIFRLKEEMMVMAGDIAAVDRKLREADSEETAAFLRDTVALREESEA